MVMNKSGRNAEYQNKTTTKRVREKNNQSLLFAFIIFSRICLSRADLAK